MRISFRTALLLGGTATLAACGQDYDPLTRDGLWHPNHSNRADLALMVANPADLVRYLMTILQGMAVQAGSGVPREGLEQLVATTMSLWPGR